MTAMTERKRQPMTAMRRSLKVSRIKVAISKRGGWVLLKILRGDIDEEMLQSPRQLTIPR